MRAGDERTPGGVASQDALDDWRTPHEAESAQPSQIDYWPTLKAENVPLTFYFNAENNWYPNFDATWKEVVASGSEIGDHTFHHCDENLTGCAGAQTPFATADLEVTNNLDYLSQTDGITTVQTMAYPYGDVNWATIAQQHYFLARGIFPGLIAPNDNSDAYNLPCMAATGGQPASAFTPSVDSAHSAGSWVIFLFHSILADDGGGANDWYAGEDIDAITGTIEYAKSKPDVWIDTMVNVGAYWIGQKTVTAVQPTTTGTGQTWSWTLPAHFPPGKFLRVRVQGGTLSQKGNTLSWDDHGYYEVALDDGSLAWTP